MDTYILRDFLFNFHELYVCYNIHTLSFYNYRDYAIHPTLIVNQNAKIS